MILQDWTADVDKNTLQLPEKAQILFEPARYKVLYGGRGSGKSHSVAKALLVFASQSRERILCAREVQKSIRDSVHRLLSDQIEQMGLSYFFKVLDTEIRGINGSEFLFTGLSNQTIDSVKSFEGVSKCWIEEGQSISDRSWDILIPTIRKEGSEIWITMNPALDTDPTYKRFILNPPAGSLVERMNYTENPFFPEVLEQERLHSQLTQDEQTYRNIWEGVCLPAVEGAIYATEVQQATLEQRITVVPYNPKFKVHTVWDMGWADSMTLILCQKTGPSRINIIGYIEDSHKTLDHYASVLNAQPYNWGDDWLPHDAFHGDYKTGQTAAQLLKKLKRRPKEVPKLGVEQGIRVARMSFPMIWFDKQRTERLVECLKRYRRTVPVTTGEPGSPVHDEYSHGADAFRYLAVVSDMMTNEDEDLPLPYGEVAFRAYDSEMGY